MTFQIPVSEMQTTAAIFVCTLVAVKLVGLFKKPRKLPPGPRGVPLLGYLPFIGKAAPVTFDDLRRTYGDVIGISMGIFPAIVISGQDTIKEALVTKGDDFAGRPAFTTARMINEGRSLAFSAFGAIWKTHRRIFVNVLHTFSNARNNPIEDIIRSEADIVAEELLAHGDSGFSPSKICYTASSSMVYQLCYGRQLNIRDDKDFQGTMEIVTEFRKFTASGNLVEFIPWLRFIMPWKLKPLSRILEVFVAGRSQKVLEHEATFSDSHLRDITDGLIKAGNTLSKEATTVGMDKTRAMESLDPIFGAGTGTVGSSLDWLMLLMAAFPDVQERVASEVECVVGSGRKPTLADRHKLPFVEATLLEMLRFASSVPMGLPHATVQDTTLKGYDIPAGTVVLVNFFSDNHDKAVWGDPDNFRPERFLTENGLQLNREKADLLAPFSLGRRRCPGESLANMELFLFFTTIMQRVRFYKPPGAPQYTLEAVYSLGRDPALYEVCVSARE